MRYASGEEAAVGDVVRTPDGRERVVSEYCGVLVICDIGFRFPTVGCALVRRASPASIDLARAMGGKVSAEMPESTRLPGWRLGAAEWEHETHGELRVEPTRSPEGFRWWRFGACGLPKPTLRAAMEAAETAAGLRKASGCPSCGIDFPEAVATGTLKHRDGCTRSHLPLQDAPPLGDADATRRRLGIAPETLPPGVARNTAGDVICAHCSTAEGQRHDDDCAALDDICRAESDGMPCSGSRGHGTHANVSFRVQWTTPADAAPRHVAHGARAWCTSCGESWPSAAPTSCACERRPCVPCGGTVGRHRAMCPTTRAAVAVKAPAATRWSAETHGGRACTSCGCIGGNGTYSGGSLAGQECGWCVRALGAPAPDGPPRQLPTAQDVWNAAPALYVARKCPRCSQATCMHARAS